MICSSTSRSMLFYRYRLSTEDPARFPLKCTLYMRNKWCFGGFCAIRWNKQWFVVCLGSAQRLWWPSWPWNDRTNIWSQAFIWCNNKTILWNFISGFTFPSPRLQMSASSAALAARRVLAAASHSSHEGGGQCLFTASFSQTQPTRTAASRLRASAPESTAFGVFCWTLTAGPAGSSSASSNHQRPYFITDVGWYHFSVPHKPYFMLSLLVFPQRGPGRYWPSCWPCPALPSAWPTPTWRCRRTHTSSPNLCRILTCVSAPRWASGCLHPCTHAVTHTHNKDTV